MIVNHDEVREWNHGGIHCRLVLDGGIKIDRAGDVRSHGKEIASTVQRKVDIGDVKGDVKMCEDGAVNRDTSESVKIVSQYSNIVCHPSIVKALYPIGFGESYDERIAEVVKMTNGVANRVMRAERFFYGENTE